jgi:predicted DCC family thiol-disulfide oxidoreductase YuxK
MATLNTMTHSQNFPLTLFYDGLCPICKLEMDQLRVRDALANASAQLLFVDIACPGFDAARFGVTLVDMQTLIHATRPDGSLVIGVPALQLAYQAVGLGAWVAPTGWPLLKPIFAWAYSWFARNRYGLSGVLLPWVRYVAARRALKRSQACADGRCVLPVYQDRRAVPTQKNQSD